MRRGSLCTFVFCSYTDIAPVPSEDGKAMCMNVYDVRLYDVVPACGMNWPPDLQDVTKYLGVSRNFGLL